MSDENTNVEADPELTDSVEDANGFHENFDRPETEALQPETPATESSGSDDLPPSEPFIPAPLRIPEVLFGSGVIFLWLFLVSAGVMVNSQVARGVIDGSYEKSLQNQLDVLNGIVAQEKAESKPTDAQIQAKLRTKEIEMIRALIVALEKKQVAGFVPTVVNPNTANPLAQSSAPATEAAPPEAANNPNDNNSNVATVTQPTVNNTNVQPANAEPNVADKPKKEDTATIQDESKAPEEEFLIAAKVRKRLQLEEKIDSLGFWNYCGAWAVVLSSFTIPNLAFLSCLAAIGGEFCRRARINEIELEKRILAQHSPRETLTYTALVGSYTAAGMRGFVVYLLVIGGLFLIDTDALVAGSAGHIQSQYIRMAGVLSVFAFITGYDSAFFRRSLGRIVGWISQTPNAAQANREDCLT